jgi:hypothetical protein
MEAAIGEFKAALAAGRPAQDIVSERRRR